MLKLPSRKQVKLFVNNVAEKGIVLLVIAYMAVSVGRSVLKNYRINQRIEALKQEIAILEQEKAHLTNLIAYYKTETFKELKTREELGLHKAGEQVLAVPVEPEEDTEGTRTYFVAKQQTEEQSPPNYVKWFRYFFSS